MKHGEKTFGSLSRCAAAALMVLLLAPATLTAGESGPPDGWEVGAAGMLVRTNESSVEYYAHGREGHVNLLPVIQEERARAEQTAASNPSKENLQLLDALIQAEEQIASIAADGPPSDPRLETEGPAALACTTYGAGAFTSALSCGNRADAYAWAATFGECQGNFFLLAAAWTSRTCYKTTDTDLDIDLKIVPPLSFDFVTANALLTGAYSSCASQSLGVAIGPGVTHIVFNNGIGTGCGTDPFRCALCARPNDDPN